ncbi:MAG: type II secretion system F family protein [Chloroflexota bacterium]
MLPQPVIVSVLGAAAVTCLVLGLWLPLIDAERSIARRLRGFVQAPIAAGDTHLALLRPRGQTTRLAAHRSTPLRFLERILEEAESTMSPGGLLLAIGIAGLVGLGGGALLLREALLAVPPGLIGAFLPLWWIRRGHKGKLARFKKQLPDTIGLLASSVRSGHSLPQALEHVAADAPEPTKSAFLLVGREIALGASQEDALERLAARYPSDDLKLIVAAINVQHQIGGSLAKILDSISETIRERIRIEGDIKALTAPQRVSAYVLCGLPIFVTIGLLLIGPDYVGVLFQPGPLRYALFSAIALVVLGFLVMRGMTKIDV